MDLTIQKSDLAKLLHLTQAIAEKKTTMPILGNLLLTADKNELKITSSDGEITAIARATADVKTPGGVAVNCKVLSELVRELPDGEVTILKTDRERLVLSSGTSIVKIIGQSSEEYPISKSLALDTSTKVSAATLAEMISKTIYAVSLDEGRYNMNGVCFELVGEKKPALRLVATDGHRLAMVTRPVEGLSLTGLVVRKNKEIEEAEGSVPDNVIVPRKGLTEIKKALESAGDVAVGVDIREGFFVVEGSTWKIVARLLDSEFPNYEQVIPKEVGQRVTVLSSDLAQALKLVSLVISDKNKGIRIDLAENMMRLTSSSPELGDAKEELTVQYSGKPFSVGFNARYMLEAVNSIGENQPYVMELTGESGPGKLYAESDESYISIVMPIRLE